MQKLALFGGEATRQTPFLESKTIGEAEKAAALRVLDSGTLSDFIGADGEKFHGGKEVLALEAVAAEYAGAKHAVSMNSATSALIAAVGACGISPGDEVIVPPYTMSASLAATLLWGAVPVFADLDPKTFTLCPDAVRGKITAHTKAIMAVDLFGLPADFTELREIADTHGLKIVEEAAQAPGAIFNGDKAGTLGDIGIYSLNYHKHIHVGEGGIAFTDDDDLAEKLRLIRNHAESVLASRPGADLTNMIGQNYRLTELQAAIATEQFHKLPELLRVRQDYCDRLSARLAHCPSFDAPHVPQNAEHAYYVYPILYRRHPGGPHRDAVTKALEAEGIPCRPVI